jgi:formyltetrahydrofolate deformylase
MNTGNAEYVLTLTCPDQPGIVHAVSGFIVQNGGNIVDSAQFGDSGTNLFCMRLHFSAQEPQSDAARLRADFSVVAERYDMNWTLHDSDSKSRVLIMVSKFDHCLIDLLYRQRIGELNIEIPAVVSNHRDTYKLVASHDIPFHYLPVTKDNKKEQEEQLLKLVEAERIDFVVLAKPWPDASSIFITLSCRDSRVRDPTTRHMSEASN